MNPIQTPGEVDHPRYRCQEFRDDADLVVTERAQPEILKLFFAHSSECADCRRYHRSLRALYRGPALPASGMTPKAQGQEFEQNFKQFTASKNSRWQRWQQQWQDHRFRQILLPLFQFQSRLHQRLAVGGGVAAIATLAFALWGSTSNSLQNESGNPLIAASQPALSPNHADSATPNAADNHASAPGWAHRARHFGRVIAGYGTIENEDSDTEATVSPESFEVGSKFYVADASAMQLSFMGKVLANFEAGTHAKWVHASSSLIAIEHQRGLIALRYDREPNDPILQIRTPDALVRVVGTVFTVDVNPAGQTAVSVLRGKIEVRAKDDDHLIAEVEAGSRFDVTTSTYSDLTRAEVAAALPLSNDASALATGLIPSSWFVPQLPDDPEKRRLESIVSTRVAKGDEIEMGEVLSDEELLAHRAHRRKSKPVAAAQHDPGEDLMAELLQGIRALELEEVEHELEHCRSLYASADTRFRAAQCLARFDRRFGNEPAAAEGLLLLGILRMDFARDYQAAIHYFSRFLRRAPVHEHAELAEYKWVLALTESGRIPEALRRGRAYLQRYPDGVYVGRVLRRLPELKSALK